MIVPPEKEEDEPEGYFIEVVYVCRAIERYYKGTDKQNLCSDVCLYEDMFHQVEHVRFPAPVECPAGGDGKQGQGKKNVKSLVAVPPSFQQVPYIRQKGYIFQPCFYFCVDGGLYFIKVAIRLGLACNGVLALYFG